MLKNSADIKQPCLTPVLTSRLDLLFCNLHVKLSKKLWMTWTICCRIPVGLGDGERLSWRTLSKAFSKYTKLMYSCLCNSVHCSMMFLRVFICSMHPFSFKNPLARWIMIFARILLGTDNREMPLQLLQYSGLLSSGSSR